MHIKFTLNNFRLQIPSELALIQSGEMPTKSSYAMSPLTCDSYSESSVLSRSLDRPKSVTLQERLSLTKTFLAAKSLNEERRL